MSEGYDGLPAYYAQSSDPITPHVGFSLKGMDPIIAENFVLADTAIGGGGGSTVKVNGSTINNPNFNGTLPAAPGGKTNVIWQFDGSGNVSAYVTSGGGGTPAGPTNSIQFNNSGSFGGISNFVIDPASGEVTIKDTSASFLGLAALSVFGNAQSDNIQDWYMDGSTAGTPDVYLDPSGDLIFTGSQVIFCKTMQSLASSASLQLDGVAAPDGFSLFDDSGNNTIFGGVSAGGIQLEAQPDGTVALFATQSSTGGMIVLEAAGSLSTIQLQAAGGVTFFSGVTPLVDNTGSAGSNGYVLSSTVTGIKWIPAPAGGVSSFTGDSVVYNNAASTGAVTLSLINQNANTVFAGPTSGAATAPTFRALVASDIPSGTVIWNAIGNAAGNLTLANAGFTTTFNQTSAVNWLWANTTAAANAGFPTRGLGAVNAASVGQGVTTLSININAGDCVVVFTSCSGASNPAITDNAAGGSNVYTQIGTQLTSFGFQNAYVSLNSKAATTITITFGGTTLYSTSAATFVSVGAVGAFSTATTNSSTASASVTTTGNQSLVIGELNCSHTSTLTPVSGSQITSVISTTEAVSVQIIQVSSLGGTGTISATVASASTWGAFVIELLSGVTNQSSPIFNLNGSYWTGTASATDSWAVQPVLSGGINPSSTLTFTHTGTSGVAAVSIPAFTNILSYGNIVEQNTTIATASTTNASPTHQLSANYWTGAASAADTWTLQSSLSAGTNGTSTLAITHSGSTGAPTVTFPIGSSGKPSIAFAGAATTGFWETSSAVVVTGGGTNVCAFASGLARLSSGGVYQWSSGDTGASAGDTGISRVSAGLIAIGNGTGGNATGNLMLGLITKYNGVNTVNGGVPAELANADLTAQTAAISANTIYVPVATGMYRVSWSATITTAGTSSSLGGTNGFQVIYTSPTDSVVKTTIVDATSISAANTTGTSVGGCLVVYAKTSTNLQYKFDYTSTGTAMQYELHVKVEAL